ncbi:MAG: hypothetical protein ACKVH8_07275, partial [Pirellulales bacterium]
YSEKLLTTKAGRHKEERKRIYDRKNNLNPKRKRGGSARKKGIHAKTQRRQEGIACADNNRVAQSAIAAAPRLRFGLG